MKYFFILINLLFLFACQENTMSRLVTSEKVAPFPKQEVPEDKPMAVLNILNFEHCSFHHITLKTQETPHIHAKHDLAVYVLKGSSWIYLNDKKIELLPGDFIVIPKGTKHYAVNTGKNPAEVLAIFSPPFDGKDVVPVSNEPAPTKP